MSGIERVYQFLGEANTYYLATVEGDQPRVRAFGTALLYDGKLYIQTGKVKPVSKQIAVNPKVEICAFKGGKWVRIAGKLVNDDNYDVKVAMLEKMPSLKAMYSADNNMQMFYFKSATATFSSFTEKPETLIGWQQSEGISRHCRRTTDDDMLFYGNRKPPICS